MSTNTNMEHISQDQFRFVQMDERIHDRQIETKPIGFFQDAMLRFSQNRGSVICGIILLILILYAIFAPIFSGYGISEKNGYYRYVLPRFSSSIDLGFWNGCTDESVNQASYDYYSGIPGAIRKENGTTTALVANKEVKMYDITVDTYSAVGYVEILLTQKEYDAARAYEAESGIQLLYPVINYDLAECKAYQSDPNAWFLTDARGTAVRDASGELQNIYLEDPTSPDGYAYYKSKQGGTQYQVRVLYSEWYYYKHGKYINYLFGGDEFGYDIFTRLAAGARLSFTLSFSAALVQLLIGVCIGALEGYYGGWFDLIVERIKDIIWEVPSVVFITVAQIRFGQKAGSTLVFWITLVIFGWMGISGTVRAQFYRFKGMEYVMAARTLGAKDKRLIFKHILPNASGFIITACVLVIPGIIFSETTYSYLGIINLNSKYMTSVGAIMSNGQATLTTYPHCLFFPAAFVSILLICFNIFGNGLRDAFNPVLRGSN